MSLSGRFFRLARQMNQGVVGPYVLIYVLDVLLGTGVGLFFSFRALAVGHSGLPIWL